MDIHINTRSGWKWAFPVRPKISSSEWDSIPLNLQKEYNLGRFSFDKKFRFQFRKIFSEEWNSIFRNFRRGQPCEVYRNFRNFFLSGNFRSVWLFSGIFHSVFRLSEIFDFLENFPGNFHTIYPRFRILNSFNWIEKFSHVEPKEKSSTNRNWNKCSYGGIEVFYLPSWEEL